ncbi:MAG: LysR family transcriptional regulator [Ktedonobacteraceae bacterium]|nr:LysR family transcriptional regulator [Ktedonobacteraceae bacterium]
MNLQNLRIFLKVAEFEHVTRAAEALHLSQPAVTRTIQNLEQEIHLDLIERHGRRIILTDAGRILQQYAQRIFALEREMEEALAALRDLESGTIAFAANPSAWIYLLPPAVAEFHRNYPRIEFHITIQNSQEIIAETLDWKVDFGLIEGDVSTLPEQIQASVLAYDVLVLIVSPHHHWAGLQQIPCEALGDGELIVREPGSGVREAIEQQLARHQVRLRPLLTLSDNEAIKQMVMSGVGAAVVSSFGVRKELANGELVSVPSCGLDWRTPISLIRRVDKRLSCAAQAFCSLLMQHRMSGQDQVTA